MRAIDPDMRQGIVFKVIYYRYYNFDLDQPFQPQYEHNNRHLLADLHRIAGNSKRQMAFRKGALFYEFTRNSGGAKIF